MKKRKVILILSIILIVTLFCITSYANQNQQEKNYQIAYYLNNKKVDKMPKNNEGVTFDHGECDNDSIVKWDYSRWGPIIKNLTKNKTKCDLYFVDDFATKIIKCGNNGKDAVTCFKENALADSINLANDTTDDNNVRYIGDAPNNYIDIGDKDSEGNPILWRIIGVMNKITNLDNGGRQESLLKIIRAESIKEYTWDTSVTEINGGWGVNEWSQADLMKLLNPSTVYSGTPEIGGSLYWNRASGRCYINPYGQSTTCNFTSSGLSEEAKEKIVKIRWNTGTFATYDNTQWTAKATYEAERGSHNGKEECTSNGGGTLCNDEVERTTTWEGYIGLMYPSDYGYAVGGEVRETCLGKSMRNYNSGSCNTNDWLKPSSITWTMTPAPYSSYAYHVFNVYSSGYVDFNGARYARGVQPVVYLSSSVKIIDGNGEIGSPYIASLN